MVTKHPNANTLPALENRGRTCAFLGFDSQHHTCHVGLHLKTSRIIYSKDVVIYEHYYAYTFEPTDYFKLGYPIDFEARRTREEILNELGVESDNESNNSDLDSNLSDSNDMEVEENENLSNNELNYESINEFNESLDNNNLVNMFINNDEPQIIRSSGRFRRPNQFLLDLVMNQTTGNKITGITFKNDNNNHLNSVIKTPVPTSYPFPNLNPIYFLLKS